MQGSGDQEDRECDKQAGQVLEAMVKAAKKAFELKVLRGAEDNLFIFSSRGKFYGFSSSKC